MKAEEYYKKHGSSLINFLNTDAGKDLVVFLQSARPQFQPLPQEHLVIELYGSIRGYEQCLKNIVSAAIPRNPPITPAISYGVTRPEEPPNFVPENKPVNP